MFSSPDQFSNATKATFETQMAAMNDLANKALKSVSDLVELNVATIKSSMEHSSAAAQQMLAAKDAQEFFSLTAANAQPNTEKAVEYARHLADITSKAQAEFTKATEIRIAETSRQVTSLIEDLAKSAPAGSENAIAMLKTTMANAHAGYEQMTKAAKQAGVAMEDNLSQATKHFTAATEKPAKAKK
jgi:phasin family protein